MRFTAIRMRMTISIQKMMQRHVRLSAQLPQWRQPLIGYLLSLVLVGIGLSIGLMEAQLLTTFAFPGLLLLFVVILVALFWGVGPALFSVLLSILVLDYLYVPPLGVVGSYGWNGLFQLFTFAAIGVIVAMLANQLETARLQALEAKQEAMMRQDELQAIFDAISDGVVVYDRHGQVLETNAAIRSLFGSYAFHVNEKEQEEQNLLLQAVQCNENGEQLPVQRQPLTRLMRGETLTGRKTIDVMVQTPDGREVTFNMSGSPVRDDTGHVERVVSVYRDVTEHRHLEQRTDEALHALLDMAQVIVQIPDLNSETEHIGAEVTLVPQAGPRLVALASSVIKSMHVVLFAIEPETTRVSLVAATGFSTAQQQQLHEQCMHPTFLADYIGSEKLAYHLEADETILLDGMTLPLYTPILPYYVQTVLAVPICVGEHLIGLLCLDDGSREHSYTRAEMNLAQTVARLFAFLVKHVPAYSDNATDASTQTEKLSVQREQTYSTHP